MRGGSNLSGDPKIKNKARLDGETAGFEPHSKPWAAWRSISSDCAGPSTKEWRANLANEECLGGEAAGFEPHSKPRAAWRFVSWYRASQPQIGGRLLPTPYLCDVCPI